MVCIYCGGDTRITNSRPQKRLGQTWRRHACLQCSSIFTTNESVDLTTSLTVSNETAAVRPFSRDKLFVSLLKALGHRQDPVKDAGALTATVIAKLTHEAKAAVVSHKAITTVALQTLKHFDRPAAVQYAAYHQL